ncbi:DUF411 domain-containing protein [Sphingoaurantiacus capsulatus]|uniref:DUF411 domain-containing protein n=1 Tax=Sphingoaurantiacus capsulatus TaxID=1771310 RepID=A0ABV7XCD9_9SPHN
MAVIERDDHAALGGRATIGESAGMDMNRRYLLAGLGAFAVTSPAAAAPKQAITVHKDANCGCCSVWAERMTATGRYAPKLINQPDMVAVKTRLRVPPELASCHTTQVGTYVVEGHVPPSAVDRLLREKPKGVIGLAVPGMPAGSPGMEMPDGRREAYDIYAFTADGRSRVFARIA